VDFMNRTDPICTGENNKFFSHNFSGIISKKDYTDGINSFAFVPGQVKKYR